MHGDAILATSQDPNIQRPPDMSQRDNGCVSDAMSQNLHNSPLVVDGVQVAVEDAPQTLKGVPLNLDRVRPPCRGCYSIN